MLSSYPAMPSSEPLSDPCPPKTRADLEWDRVLEALAGRCYLTPAIAQRLAREVAAPSDKPVHEKLSDREYQVMKMLAAGKTVKEVAADLSLSVKTVSTYRTRILEKLGLTSNVDIARFAIKAGLVG